MARTTNLQGGRDDNPPPERVSVEVVNSEVIYEGAFTCVRDAGNATAANQGRLNAYDGAAGSVFVGEALPIQDPNVSESDGDYTFDGSVTGNTGADNPPRAAQAITGRTLLSQTVTGASAISDRLKPVFLSDDDTFTLTPQTRPEAVAVVQKWITGTTCDLLLLPLTARCAGSFQVERLYVTVGAIDFTTGTLDSAGDLVTGYTMPYKGMILAVGYHAATAITGSPAAVINAELGGTNVTGGTVTVAATGVNAVGVGTSFATAGHFFSRGDTLDIETDGGTAASAGTAQIFVDVLRLPGT